MLALDKVDPQYRLLVDKLFFTDNMNLDLSNLKTLLENSETHHAYLWDRFTRSAEVFWDESFWINRLDVILSLQSKRLDSEVGTFLLGRFRRLIDLRPNPTPKLDNEFIQFKAWTKVLVSHKENITPIKDFFLQLVHSVPVGKITNIIGHFVPHLFQDANDYLELLGRKVSDSARSFQVLKELAEQGVPIDKKPLFKQARNLLLKRALNRPNRRSLFAMMDDKEIMGHLKLEYKPESRSRLIDFIKSCDYNEIEEYHLRNVKNLLELDSSITEELFEHYADRLWARGYGNRGANVKRLIRLCKTIPVFSPKKALVYLSTTGKMSDIKSLISAFPELKVLAPFI